MATINWFPGHMKKTKREIVENLKLVDAVIEIRDARIPRSSANPDIDKICAGKPRVILLNKSDLSESSVTKAWVKELSNENVRVLEVNCLRGQGLQQIKPALLDLLKEKHERAKAKGLVKFMMRVMVVGIPNCGKSTFINKMARNNIAKTGDRAGVTKSKQWIKTSLDMEMLDTPGVLWPKFEDEHIAKNIAMIGSIKQNILPLDDLFIEAMTYLSQNYSSILKERYQLEIDLEDPDWVLKTFDHIAQLRKIKPLKGETDYDRVIELFFSEINDGSIGRITWEDTSCVKD